MKPNLDPTKCCKIVYFGDWIRTPKQCTRKWSIRRGTKCYCKQHDPIVVEAREQQRSRRYNYDSARHAMGWVGVPLYDALEELVIERNDEAIKKAKKALKNAKSYRETLRKGKSQ